MCISGGPTLRLCFGIELFRIPHWFVGGFTQLTYGNCLNLGSKNDVALLSLWVWMEVEEFMSWCERCKLLVSVVATLASS